MLLLAAVSAAVGLLFRFMIWAAVSPVSMVGAGESAAGGQTEAAVQTECSAAPQEAGLREDGLQPAQRPVIVIDAGHGGMDGGASSAEGVREKDINLAIARCLEAEAAQYPVEVIMTRTDDRGLYTDDARPIRAKKREDLQRRKELMEGETVTLGISIHLNSFPQDASVYGAQVFYPKEACTGTDVSQVCAQSKQYAESIQKRLETNISDGRERSAMAKSDILLFAQVQHPMVLVECGFLSNLDECERLETPAYQQLLACAIWEGVNEILCLEKNKSVTVIDSANRG